MVFVISMVSVISVDSALNSLFEAVWVVFVVFVIFVISFVFVKRRPVCKSYVWQTIGLEMPDLDSRTKNQPKEEVFGTDIPRTSGVIRADIPAQNFGQGAQNPGKPSI